MLPQAAAAQDATREPGIVRRTIATVGRDLKSLPSKESVALISSATAFALFASPFDKTLTYSASAAGTFATAAVLQRHFGWKASVPAYAAAVLVSGARLQANSHYATDVIAGAAVGILAGRAATFEVAGSRVSLSPAVMPGGASLTFHIGRSAFSRSE